jgi:hypothetical protein
MSGDYPKRGEVDEERPLGPDIDEAARHYASEAKQAVEQVVDSAKRAADAFSEAFRKRTP